MSQGRPWDTLGELVRAWNRLTKHRQFERSVKGWFRAIEITRNPKDGTYHPHIHAILAVPPGYFTRGEGLYIEQSEWVDRWQKALRADYRPLVSIQTAKAKGEYVGGRAAAVEAAKYAVKDSDYIDDRLSEAEAVRIVTDYTEALHRRRLTAYGGWLKTAAKALEAQGVSAAVIDMFTIKPLDEKIIIDSARKTGKVVTVEEHSVIGGLGSAVCDCLSANLPTPVKKIGMQDVFGESGSASALVAKYGLDAEGVYKSVKEFM